MKRIILTSFILLTVLTIQAQVVAWAVKPGVYSKIEPFTNDMFLVYKGTQVGVVQGDGRIVVPAEASRITGFYGGLALVLRADGGKERVMGVLTAEGAYSKLDGAYYTIPNQEFFSEGLLTVTDARGDAGFMTVNGSVHTFDVDFVSPFSEGYATVGDGADFRIINKSYNPLSIQLGVVSQVYGGSNVYQGIAVVWDGNGKLYDFNVKTGACAAMKGSRKSLVNLNNLQWDYLGGLSTVTNRPEQVPYDAPQQLPVTLKTTQQGDRYGYAKGGQVVIPCQFDMAEDFHGSHAVVRQNGRYGLLALHEGNDDFRVVATNQKISYKKSDNKPLSHRFTLAVPASWSGEELNITVTGQNGATMNATQKDGSYEFMSEAVSEECKYLVEVSAGGLSLWTGELAYSYVPKSDPVIVTPTPLQYKPLSVTLKPVNKQADQNHRCYVKATISNPNPEPISTLVTMTGTNLLETVSQRVTVPAHGTKDISTYFTVKKVASGQKVTVTSSAGGQATLDGLQLIPF